MKIYTRSRTAAEPTGHVLGEFVAVCAIAGSFGLGTGLLTGSVLTILEAVPGWMTWNMIPVAGVPIDVLWVSPSVNALMFVAVSVLVWGSCRLSQLMAGCPRIAPLRVIMHLVSGLAVYVVTSVPGRLYWWASVGLAAGVAFRLVPTFRLELVRRTAQVRRVGALLLLVVISLRLCLWGGSALAERARIAALPRPQPGLPNVLLVVLDTVRADHLSVYGYSRLTTPNLDRFAAEGVLFERAIAPSSWSVPSHASLMTGRPVYQHSTDSSNPTMGPENPTIAEVLSSKGYATAGFSANTAWITRNMGFARGFSHFEDYYEVPSDWVARTVLGRTVVAPVRRALGERSPFARREAADVNVGFLEWLDGHGRRPFFAFINYFDVHQPYVSPPPYQTRFMSAALRGIERGFAFQPPLLSSQTAPGEAPAYIAAYDGALAYLDARFGQLLEQLRARGVLDTTIVVAVSDHGEAFGEHGFYSHGHSQYMDQIHVPLLIRYPGTVPAGVRVRTTVSTADVPATIMGLLRSDAKSPLGGASLARSWGSDTAMQAFDAAPVLSEVTRREGVPESWPIGKGWLRSLVTNEWHFIQHEHGSVELYRLADDPGELHDLSQTPEGRILCDQFLRRLAGLVPYGLD